MITTTAVIPLALVDVEISLVTAGRCAVSLREGGGGNESGARCRLRGSLMSLKMVTVAEELD
jgi:hypothetical protein